MLHNARPSGYSLHRILDFAATLLLASFAAGCGIRPAGIYQVGNWGPSTFVEDDFIVKLYTKQVENRPHTSWGESTSNTYSNIFAEQPNKFARNDFDQSGIHSLWFTAPPWRREENLIAIGKRLTADQLPNLQRFLISSHGPIVIAMTDQPCEFGDPFFNFNFFIPADRSNPIVNARFQKITRLFICRSWPTPDEKLGVPAEREILDLPTPMSAEELMQTHPWTNHSTTPSTK